MADNTIEILVNQEVEKLKQAGYKRVSVTRTSMLVTSNYSDIQLNNDIAVVEKVVFDARALLDNVSRTMICLTSISGFIEEQLANAEMFEGFLAKRNIKCWIHDDNNHYIDKQDNIVNPEPSVTPLKIHLIRITPLKN